jgi:hypothetical protein
VPGSWIVSRPARNAARLDAWRICYRTGLDEHLVERLLRLAAFRPGRNQMTHSEVLRGIAGRSDLRREQLSAAATCSRYVPVFVMCATDCWISFFSVGRSTSSILLMYKHPFPVLCFPSFFNNSP